MLFVRAFMRYAMCVGLCTLSIIYFSYLKLHRKIQKMRIYTNNKRFSKGFFRFCHWIVFHSILLLFTSPIFFMCFSLEKENEIPVSLSHIHNFLFIACFFCNCFAFSMFSSIHVYDCCPNKRNSKPRKPENKIYKKNKWHFICNTVFSVYRQ